MTLIKNMEHVTKPQFPLLTALNDFSLMRSCCRQCPLVARVHPSTPSSRLPIQYATNFSNPFYDIYTVDSTSSSTQVFDGIRDFQYPAITDDHYYNWQSVARWRNSSRHPWTLCSMQQSWLNMMNSLPTNMAPSHFSASSPTVSQSEKARCHLLCFIKDFDIRHYHTLVKMFPF